MAFGEHLKRIMAEKNISVEALAEKLGVKPPMVSQWRSGAKGNPKEGTITSIATALVKTTGVGSISRLG